MHVSLSSEVLPRVREWPRMSTTLLNAYLEPVMVHYIDHLNQGLERRSASESQQRFLMQSNGGVMPFSAAITGGRTVHTLFSGPAAGAQASAYLAREAARRTRHPRHGRHQLRHRLHRRRRAARNDGGHHRPPPGRRAGARHDHDLGRRRLDRRPSTAAASSPSARTAPAPIPGPACYGRGGTQPTVTDADLVCGFLNADYFLGGKQKLDAAAVARGARAAHRQAARRSACSMPPPASAASSTCAWPTRSACSRPSAASICAPSRCCRSAAPARCMPRRSPRSLACGASWCRRGRARSRRWACSAPTWCTTTSARSCGRSPRSTPTMPRSIFAQLEAKARHELAAEGMDASSRTVRARARSSLQRPGLRAAHAARRPFSTGLDQGGAGRRARRVSTSATHKSTAMPPRSGRSSW